ncbi:Serine aminopeptidase, S33 [Sphingomonas guangdongensis]|uniref:Serine aminopeptidase, S33 n=1 Tax=Sphingomonas guangdongensis TaxID=1141890 RepID=A0A285R297_9SPHN|nr:alpha/beta fold hydrolase [Sphingomonas guangdongensis]SOB88236.1 Serine aminopeptidase, S33 [Sphingomonas guangdongensis]
MKRWLVPVVSMAVLVSPTAAQSPADPAQLLPGGARWASERPANWNGTLLLWSRGYSPTVGKPETAPAALREALLARGYAIAGSDYGSGGWALEEAVPAQRATIAAFAARHGKPKRVIAWGYSMGGLVTTALAEQRPAAIDGAVALCASIGGAVGMMNMALDGATAFRTLVAPDAGIRVVDIDDDMANGKKVEAAVADAAATPAGRARIALAGVLAGIPGWTSRDRAEPAPTDYAAQADEIARSFSRGVFLPRLDQERRAGGVFSWTTGVDYRRQLDQSGRRAMVAALYRAAGLDLDADLKRLQAAPPIAAKPAAVRYMMQHYTPNARAAVPLIAVQAIGDGLTAPALQRGYAEAAGARVQSLWVRQAGHCTFTPDTVLASIRYLEARLDSGRWPGRPAGFVAHTPSPMLRPCVRGVRCK